MTFSKFAKIVYTFSASSKATIFSILIVLVWAFSGPFFHYSDSWQLVLNSGTSAITFIMVFVINNAQARDTAAINAKLDAPILANQDIDNKLVSIEDSTDEHVVAVRSDIREAANPDTTITT